MRLSASILIAGLILIAPPAGGYNFAPSVCAADEDIPKTFPLGASEKELVAVTDDGLSPRTIKLSQLDGSVFFVNRTNDSLISVSVEFGKRRAHCASENMRLDAAGNLASITPVGPHDFAIMCFPDKGTYPVTVNGIGPSGKKATGEVVVE
jgi:hypothetical protein